LSTRALNEAFLILPRGDQLWVEAEAATGRKTIEVSLRPALVAPAELPLSILQYAIRTKEPLVCDDASKERPFSADQCVTSKHVRSVLCLPLIKQVKLVGLLYLENNVAASVFTPARIAVLKMLASQAAISLENARLYGELTMSEERWRNLFESVPVGVALLGSDRRYVAAKNSVALRPWTSPMRTTGPPLRKSSRRSWPVNPTFSTARSVTCARMAA
jgi:GAF domain-containing protein